MLTATTIVAMVWVTGCVGQRSDGEKHAQQVLAITEEHYRPANSRPQLPKLATDVPLHNFLLFAVFNQPRVEVAYFDWVASVRRITLERSLPDPQLTFQSDIADMVTTLMPGLMIDLPGPGKLKWAANVASAESEARYFAFESAILQIAFELKKAYYNLYFLNARVTVNRDTLQLVEQIERLARAQNEVGKVTLQDVLRAEIERKRITTEITNLEDSRNPLLAQFKAALGLKDEDSTPPVPQKFESTPLDLTSDQLFKTALARNPRLKAMEAEVRRADATIRLAYKARVPDFSAGVEVDVKTSPILATPQLGVTLPIWRDKIAAQIGEAQAGKQASEARLSSEQIALAVEFAEKSFMFREATRNFELITERLLPKARQSLDVAQSGYVSGRVDFLSLLDAQRTLLGFQLSEIDARVQREVALAELSLLILGTPLDGAPMLPPDANFEKERKP